MKSIVSRTFLGIFPEARNDQQLQKWLETKDKKPVLCVSVKN